jgi:hypothetical protein
MKKLLVICFIIILAAALASCGKCKSHTDTNKDGVCDNCGASMDTKPNAPDEPGTPDEPEAPENKEDIHLPKDEF